MGDLKLGDVVIYVDKFDSDYSYSPNLGPALVTKVNKDSTFDLYVLSMNGAFYKLNVSESLPQEQKRGTFYRK